MLSGSPPGSVPAAVIVNGVPEVTVMGDAGVTETIGVLTATATDTGAKADPALFDTVTVKFSVVFAATNGVVKVAVAVFAFVRVTCTVSVTACDQANVSGVVPLALALRVTSVLLPEITEAGVAVAVTALGATIEPGQLESEGAVAPGQGLSCPASVPADDVYPPQARNWIASKLLGMIGEPGMFSGKMYVKMGAWYCP
jgi:hypothetical protein